MAAYALAAYGVIGVLALGGRVWLHRRRTGEAGLRGLQGGRTQRMAGALALSGTLGIIAAPIAELFGLLRPIESLAGFGSRGLGLAVVALGTVVIVVAQGQMGDSWRIGVDRGETTALVTRGLFRYCRNPIFSGMLVAAAGSMLLVPNVASFVGAALAAIGLEILVRHVEEPHLLETHGERYRGSARTVGRFLPGLGHLR